MYFKQLSVKLKAFNPIGQSIQSDAVFFWLWQNSLNMPAFIMQPELRFTEFQHFTNYKALRTGFFFKFIYFI